MRRYLSAIGIGLALLSLSVPAVAKKHHHAAANPANTPAAMSDERLQVKAGPVDGSYAVHIFGHGPASTPIRLYVGVWLSKDLPVIPLGTNNGYQNVVTDSDGNFAIDVSLANNYWEHSLVKIEASSVENRLYSSTSYYLQPPSMSVHTKDDRVQQL